MNNLERLLKLANNYEANCFHLISVARIVKLPDGQYRVLSEKGKNLGTSKTKQEAIERLQEVEFFKHQDELAAENDGKIINLLNATDFSLSAIMREMRQKASKEQVREFLAIFKKEFDNAIKNELQKPDRIALQNALTKFNKKHKIKVNEKLVKNAALSELGTPAQVGKFLADTVKFTINRIPIEKRQKALESLRHKFNSFDVNDIAQKNLPIMASMGQAITFVKTILFNHDAHYIREVLNNLVRNL